MALLTPKKCVNLDVNTYPSLYASAGYELAKLRVYDHIFNVIGNGIRDTEEFKYHMRNRRKGVQTPPAKYLSGEPLFRGYTEVTSYGEEYDLDDERFLMPVNGSDLEELFSEAEKADHPEVKRWIKVNANTKFIPYPNFEKTYSIVWRMDTALLTEEWIDEIIWFYRKCEEFFDGPNSYEYHSAIPADARQLERRVKDQDQHLTKYMKADKPVEECWADITAAYGTEYRGDTLDFLQRRWEKEHNRIRAYITETIAMLEGLKA